MNINRSGYIIVKKLLVIFNIFLAESVNWFWRQILLVFPLSSAIVCSTELSKQNLPTNYRQSFNECQSAKSFHILVIAIYFTINDVIVLILVKIRYITFLCRWSKWPIKVFQGLRYVTSKAYDDSSFRNFICWCGLFNWLFYCITEFVRMRDLRNLVITIRCISSP